MTTSDPPAGPEPTSEDESSATAGTSRRTFLTGVAAGAVAAGVPTSIVAFRSDSRRVVAAPPTEPTAEIAATPTAEPTPSSTPTAVPAPPTPTTTATTATTPPSAAEQRRAASLEVRERAARMAFDMDMAQHEANGEERADIGYAFSFTKGLPHDYETGLVTRTDDFALFVAAVEGATPEHFVATPLGPDDGFRTAPDDTPLRGWESQGVGLGYDLIGADMQALTMPPAPTVGSSELSGELAELYAQSLLRDEVLANLRFEGRSTPAQDRVIDGLRQLEWFDESGSLVDLSAEARQRRRPITGLQTVFRGRAPGDTVGPYVSQLLLAGSPLPEVGRTAADGLLQYGAQTINQRVRQAARVDFMTSWDDWFDVQNALAPGSSQVFQGGDRFITSGRDLATYVHTDALFQPYFNACLLLLAHGAPLDPGMPFVGRDADDHQHGFVLFAPNHVFSLLGEVSIRAQKTVKYQKFNVHRRLRPEELAGRVERAELLDIAELGRLAADLDRSPLGADVRAKNELTSGTASMLLPMAYAEGSPMHPSYGAGHATVAGACATIIKAMFDHTHPVEMAGSASTAFIATRDGSALEVVRVHDEQGKPAELTVEGEVNKLAANIAIARNWAGVHYFSDYWESILLGEAIAVEILREHMVTMTLDVTITIPTFQGSTITLTT